MIVKKKTTAFSIDDDLPKQIEVLYKRHNYRSGSELVDEAIKEKIAKLKKKKANAKV